MDPYFYITYTTYPGSLIKTTDGQHETLQAALEEAIPYLTEDNRVTIEKVPANGIAPVRVGLLSLRGAV